MQEQPVVECASGLKKHVGPIWQIVWLDEGPQKGESLVTCGADGRVCLWNYTKACTSSL